MTMNGGYLVGNSHADGGIKIKTPEGQIEAEGNEVIINKRALSLEDKYICEGTPKEMTSKINEMEGGVSWSKTGSCRLVSKAEDGTEIVENFTENSGGNYINTLGYELIDNFDGTYQVLDPDGMDIVGQYETLEQAMQTVKEHMENSDMDSHFSDDEKAALGSYIFGDRSKAELNREDVKSNITLMDKEYSEARKDYKFGFITQEEYFELKREIVDKYAVYINAAERLNIVVNQGISFGVKKDGNNPPTEQASSGSILRSSNPEKRPSPSISATIYPAGYTMEGNDGNTWAISLDSRGIHRWKRVMAEDGVFIDERDNTKYFVNKNSKGEWTVFSENEGQWSYRDEFPFMNGFETEEDAILIAQGMAGLRGEFAENGKKVEEREPMFVYNYGFTYYDHNKDTINYYYTFYKGDNAICDIYFDVYYGAKEDFDYSRNWDSATESVYDTKYSFTEMRTNGFEIINYFEVDSGITEGLLVELGPEDKAIALKEITAIYEDKVATQQANELNAIILTKEEKYKILASKNLAANGKQISKCDCGCGVAKDGAEVSSCGCSHSKYKDGGMVDYYKDKQSGKIVTEQEMLDMVDENDQLDSFYLIGSFSSKDAYKDRVVISEIGSYSNEIDAKKVADSNNKFFKETNQPIVAEVISYPMDMRGREVKIIKVVAFKKEKYKTGGGVGGTKIKVSFYKYGEYQGDEEIDHDDLPTTELGSDDLDGFNIRDEDANKHFYAEDIDIDSDDDGTSVKRAYATDKHYADGGGVSKAGKELWFSPSGELKTEKKGTAKHYIEQYLAKRFGAESMELVSEDEKDYIYELNGNPMMIAAKTAILEEENSLDVETYGRKKRVHIPKSGIDQTSVSLRYPLITPYKNGGFVGKGELVWRKLSSADKMLFLIKNFKTEITDRSKEDIVNKSYNFIPRNVKMALNSEYANVEEFKTGGSVGINSQIEELEAQKVILNNKLMDISMGVIDRKEKPKVENQMQILSSQINELLKNKYGRKMTNGGGLDTDDFEMDNSTYTIRMWDTDMDKLNGVNPLIMTYKIKSQALDLANRFYYENDYGVIEVEDENGNRVLTLDAYAANGKSISMNVDKGIGYLPDNYSEHAIMMDGEIYTGDSYYNIVSNQGPNFFNRDESERGYVDNMGEFYDEEIGRESLAADGKPIQEADYLTNAMLSVLDLKNYLDSHNDQIIINGSKYNYLSHAQYNLRVTGGQGAVYNIIPYFPETTIGQLQNGKFYTLLRKDRAHNFAISVDGLVLDIAEDGMDVA